MKKWILLIWLFCVQLLAVHAENEYYTIFKVGSNICTPVIHIPEHTRSLSGSLLGYKTIP